MRTENFMEIELRTVNDGEDHSFFTTLHLQL